MKQSEARQVNLAAFNNDWYNPGGNFIKRVCWYFTNILFFLNPCCTSSRIKRSLLRMYGAKIGERVVIKPGVNIKYPWRLNVGDNTWIGEKAWIDNLGEVKIGSNVCLSQGSMLLCGNHDYSKTSFDLIIGDITLEDGSWIGAKAIVGPGVTAGKNVVLSAGSVASRNMDPDKIYRGNPAEIVKERVIDG